MYEYTVVHPFTMNGRVFGIGQKITDPDLAALLELPRYARNVSRHYVTTPADDAPEEVDGAASARKDDKSAESQSDRRGSKLVSAE